MDPQLSLEVFEEDLPAASRQAESLGLPLERGADGRRQDLYVEHLAPDSAHYLLRLRCDSYDEIPPSFQFVDPVDRDATGAQWWPRMSGLGYPRGDQGEIVYCVIGIREYHAHPSHRAEVHDKAMWRLARVIALAWQYFHVSGEYAGRGGM